MMCEESSIYLCMNLSCASLFFPILSDRSDIDDFERARPGWAILSYEHSYAFLILFSGCLSVRPSFPMAIIASPSSVPKHSLRFSLMSEPSSSRRAVALYSRGADIDLRSSAFILMSALISPFSSSRRPRYFPGFVMVLFLSEE